MELDDDLPTPDVGADDHRARLLARPFRHLSQDLRVVVVRECGWSVDPAAHAYSLNKAIEMYAQVRTLEQTMAMLGR